ncbi:MAG TPA: hypothetical protein VLZ51_08225, partial [Brevundimonas sp.]|nr:hypothetical protein [Brevundimonas sp.]
SYAIAPAYGLTAAGARRLPALGQAVTETPAAVAGVFGPDEAYAYVAEWRDLNAPRLLAALLRRDVRVRTAFEPFTADTSAGQAAFGRGALVIPSAGQTLDAAALRAAVDEAAHEAGGTAFALRTGQSASGVDLGSDSVRPIRAPKIALVMGEGVNATEIGSTWFALSERLNWPATRLDPAQIGRVSLDQYTSIVLSGGRYDDWSDRSVEALRRWIQAGGSLVTYGSASRWALAKGLTGAAPRDAASETAPDTSRKTETRRDFAERGDALADQRSAGNAVSADADITHPLAFGLPQRTLFVSKETDVVLPAAADAFSDVVRIDDTPRINGYLPDGLRRNLSGAVWAQTARYGAGNVVLFADDPAHRKYWLGTERLLINALFLSNHLAPAERR